MTLDAHVTGIWCGQIGGGVGIYRVHIGFMGSTVLLGFEAIVNRPF